MPRFLREERLSSISDGRFAPFRFFQNLSSTGGGGGGSLKSFSFFVLKENFSTEEVSSFRKENRIETNPVITREFFPHGQTSPVWTLFTGKLNRSNFILSMQRLQRCPMEAERAKSPNCFVLHQLFPTCVSFGTVEKRRLYASGINAVLSGVQLRQNTARTCS